MVQPLQDKTSGHHRDDTLAHESFQREEAIRLPSSRSFGLGGGVIFLIIGLYPLYGGGGVRPWALVIASAWTVLALAAASVLTPLLRAWMRFGLLLNRIVNPIVLGVMFYLVVLPMGLALRLVRRTSLRQGFNATAASYWETRTPPGPKPESLERQF